MNIRKAIYGCEPYEYRMVQPSEFPELDCEFYDRARSWFETRGFRFLGDRENVTLSRIVPSSRTFIRTMVSADGTIVGCACHVKLQNARGFRTEARVIELETELSDGTFVSTSNAWAATRNRPVPGIEAERFPEETPADELLRIHGERLASIVESRSHLVDTQLQTIDDVIRFQRRMQAVAAKHMRSLGHMTTYGIAGTLMAIAFINWFLFFGISSYLGGDALNTLPSRDGFVLTSHGNQTLVSEPVWICDLLYSGATLLLTPLVLLIGAIASGSLLRRERASTKWGLLCFIAIWLIGWEWSIGSAVSRSAVDWFRLRQTKAAAVKEA
jgi:hypothetical protein